MPSPELDLMKHATEHTLHMCAAMCVDLAQKMLDGRLPLRDGPTTLCILGESILQALDEMEGRP